VGKEELQNIYDEGYHTGADVSIFIGPLWVSEAVNIYLRTATNDIVVYPYSDPHYARSLIGRYIVQGSLTVNVTEPDYLLRLIEAARRESITASALKELVERRKAVFQQTLSDRLINTLLGKGSITLGGNSTTEEMLLKYVTDYTERVTREVELMSVRYNDEGKRLIDPRTFELTIISGKLGSSVESIEIFQDVKVIGTERVSENNDETQTVTYSIIARRKPPLVVDKPQILVQPKNASFVTENLLSCAETIVRNLVYEVLTTPEVYAFQTAVRVKEIIGNPNVGYVGNIHSKTRFYGPNSQYSELVWKLALPKFYCITMKAEDKPDVTLLIPKGGTAVEEVHTKLSPPRLENNPPAFSNAYGRIASINKDFTLDGIKAIASVVITPLEKRDGLGTLYAPRKRKSGFGVGSLTPPQLVDPEVFGFTDDLIDDVTASTLWTMPFSVRALASNIKEPTYTEDNEAITEVIQPLYTLSRIDNFTITKDGITFTYPVQIDFINIDKKDDEGQLAATEPLPEGTAKDTITIKFDGTFESTYQGFNTFSDCAVAFTWSVIDIKDIPTADNLSDIKYGLVTLDMTSIPQISGFGRSVTLRPFVFVNAPKPEELLSHITCVDGSHTVDSEYRESFYTQTPSALGDVLHYKNDDRACQLTLDYDFVVSGMTETFLNLDGSFYLRRPFETKVTCPYCSGVVAPDDLSLPDEVVILWLLISAPTSSQLTSDKRGKGGAVSVVHDTTMKQSRIAEFYSIVRCDTRAYDVAVTRSAGEMFVKNLTESIEDIWYAIQFAFGSIGNINRSIPGYVYPVKGSMGKIAQEFASYAIDIRVSEIVDQLSKCCIDSVKPPSGTTVEGVDPKSSEPITLLSALAHSRYRTGKPFNGGEEGARKELAGIVRKVLTEAYTSGPYNVISENDRTTVVTVRKHVLTTQPSLICFGLTDRGYKILKQSPATKQPPIPIPGYKKGR